MGYVGQAPLATNVTSSDIVKWIVESPWTLGNSQDFDYSTVRTQ